MEWVAALIVGALVVGVIYGLAYLASDDPQLFGWIAAFTLLSLLVGWGLAHWFGWWEAWTRG